MKINKVVVFTTATLLLGATLLNAKVVDSTIATVNGQAILSSQFDPLVDAVLAEYKAQKPELLDTTKNPNATNIVNGIKQEVLNNLIVENLLTQTAKTEGIKVKDSELAQGINEIKARMSINPQTGAKLSEDAVEKLFKEELKKENMTYKQFEDKIKDQLSVRKLMDQIVKSKAKQPTKEQAKALYDDVLVIMSGDEAKIKALPKERLEKGIPLAMKLNQLTAEQIKINPIFIKFDANDKKDIKEKEKLAKEVRSEMVKAKTPMVELIKKYSDDKESLKTGGEMILIRGVMPKAFDEQIFKVNVGEVSQPIKADEGFEVKGFYVIKVQEKKAKKDFTFDQIANDLGNYLATISMQQAMVDYLTELKDKSDVKIMIDLGTPVQQQATTNTNTATK